MIDELDNIEQYVLTAHRIAAFAHGSITTRLEADKVSGFIGNPSIYADPYSWSPNHVTIMRYTISDWMDGHELNAWPESVGYIVPTKDTILEGLGRPANEQEIADAPKSITREDEPRIIFETDLYDALDWGRILEDDITEAIQEYSKAFGDRL